MSDMNVTSPSLTGVPSKVTFPDTSPRAGPFFPWQPAIPKTVAKAIAGRTIALSRRETNPNTVISSMGRRIKKPGRGDPWPPQPGKSQRGTVVDPQVGCLLPLDDVAVVPVHQVLEGDEVKGFLEELDAAVREQQFAPPG